MSHQFCKDSFNKTMSLYHLKVHILSESLSPLSVVDDCGDCPALLADLHGSRGRTGECGDRDGRLHPGERCEGDGQRV